MNININSGNIFGNQNIGNMSESGKSEVAEDVKKIMQALGLSEGDVFDGKIQDIIGNTVKINLAGGEKLSAVLDAKVGLNIGDEVSFKVKGSEGSKLLLQTISNQNTDNISKIVLNMLEQSGFATTERNISMVREMMSYGMAVDKASLASMERNINTYPNAAVYDVVALVSHSIPLNDINLEQFQNYKSLNYQISENIADFSEAFTQTVENTQDREFLNNILETLKNIIMDNSSAPYTDKSIDGAKKEVVIAENEAEILKQTGTEAKVDKQAENVLLTDTKAQEAYKNISNDMNTTAKYEVNPPVLKATSENENKVFNPDIEKIVRSTIEGNNDKYSEVEGNVNKIKFIETDSNSPELTDIKKEICKLIKKLTGRWIVEPEKNTETEALEIKEDVNQKLKNIAADSERILQVFKNNSLKKNDLYEITRNMRNNINFMNDLSHMTEYIQIPFKTHYGEANAELYVYRKNKGRQSKNQLLTAFLHLDMEYLGGTDVKVVLDTKSNKIHTGFTLKDVSSQSLVEENLPWLQKRLERLGYSAELRIEDVFENDSSHHLPNEYEKSPFERIMEADKPRKEIKRYSFDIRL